MMSAPYKSTIPEASQILHLVPGSYFHDSWSIRTRQPELSVFEQFVKVFAHTPRWIECSMLLRNKIVATVGLKDLGSFSKIDPNKSESDYKPGDKIGIFTLLQKTHDELVVGDDDKHLNVVLSIYKDEVQSTITITTIVHVKNLLGKLYMLPVMPMHKIIAPATLKNLG